MALTDWSIGRFAAVIAGGCLASVALAVGGAAVGARWSERVGAVLYVAALAGAGVTAWLGVEARFSARLGGPRRRRDASLATVADGATRHRQPPPRPSAASRPIGGRETTLSLRSWLSLDPAPGWALEEHADHLALVPAHGEALLRLSSFSVEETGTGAAQWVEAAAHFNRRRGRPVAPVRCGDFVGHVTAFAADGTWFRGWTLRARDVPLDVTYTCAEAAAGRDDPVVDAMLQTLRFREPRRR